jgi:hypothetical protein
LMQAFNLMNQGKLKIKGKWFQKSIKGIEAY